MNKKKKSRTGALGDRVRQAADGFKKKAERARKMSEENLNNQQQTGEEAPQEAPQAENEAGQQAAPDAAALAAELVRCAPVERLLVAGGETSGAVIRKLGYRAFRIGESLSPGVPVLYPAENPRLRIVLKSGNFGGPDFFLTTLKE